MLDMSPTPGSRVETSAVELPGGPCIIFMRRIAKLPLRAEKLKTIPETSPF